MKTICCLRCYLFFPFSPHIFQPNWLPFFTSYVSSKLAASNVAIFLPLKYFVFWVKNYFRQKIYLRFCFEVPYAVSDVTSFFLFTSYVSYKLSASNVAFFCLILPFKYFVFCRKIWFSTKDISSLLLWSTICCLRCCFFFPLSPHVFHLNRLLFFTSYVSPRSGCFFHVICFIKTGCFFHVHNNN